MKENKTKYLIYFLYFSLLVLPIFDFLVDEENLTVGSGPNVVFRALVIVIMLFLFVFWRGLLQKQKNSITNCILFLMLYMVVISLFFSPSFSTVYTLAQIEYSFLGFLCFYCLTKQSVLEEKRFSFFFIVLIVVITTTVYLNLSIREDTSGLNKADNTGYALVCTYAGIMLLVDKKPFSLFVFLVVLGSVVAGKRGAIIAMAVATLPLLRYTLTNKNWKTYKKLLFLILITAGTYVALRYFDQYIDAAVERFNNLEEDEGSGRSMVYSIYLNQFNTANLSNQIFGHGLFAGTSGQYSFTRFQAHNDWLELLFDFGIIGAFTYAIIFILLFSLLIKYRRQKNRYYYMLEMSYIIWFIKSIFSSTFLMDVNSIYLYMTAAYAIAKLEQGELITNQVIQERLE